MIKNNRCFKVTRYECMGNEKECKYFKRHKYGDEYTCEYQDMNDFACYNKKAIKKARDYDL